MKVQSKNGDNSIETEHNMRTIKVRLKTLNIEAMYQDLFTEAF